MNRRRFLQCAATGLFVPSAMALPPVARRRMSIPSSFPWGTYTFANGIPGFFVNPGTWSVSGGYLVNNPTVSETNLITNGTFDTDSDWTKGTGWTIDTADSNVANCAATAYSNLSQTCLTEGSYYHASSDLVRRVSGSGQIVFGGVTCVNLGTSIATAHGSGLAESNSFSLKSSNTVCDFDVDNIICNSLTDVMILCDTKTPNTEISINIQSLSASDMCGIIYNYVDNSMYGYANYLLAKTAYSSYLVAGDATNKVNVDCGIYSSPDTISIRSSGGNVSMYRNGTQYGSTFSLPSQLISGTIFGIISTINTNQIISVTLSKA